MPDSFHLASGTVAGTVILLKDAGWKESDVPALLGSLDKDFLPDVDLDHGNLNYMVVIGEVLGNFEAQKNPKWNPTLNIQYAKSDSACYRINAIRMPLSIE